MPLRLIYNNSICLFALALFLGACSKKEVIHAPDTYAISGRVATATGDPIADVQIQLIGKTTNLFATTDASGNYTATGLSGSYLAKAVKTGFVFLPPSIEISGSRIDVVFTRKDTAGPPTHALSGKVTDPDGKGIKGVQINLVGAVAQSVFTDSTGAWIVENLLGSYSIQPSLAGASFVPDFIVADAARTDVNFTRTETLAEYYKVEGIHAWLAANQHSNGLVTVTSSSFVSLYDQSLAALSFMALGDNARAEKIFDYFDARINSELKVAPGGFYQFRDVNGTISTDSPHWVGDVAWLLIALNYYEAYIDANKYETLQTEIENWIRSLANADGNIKGGYTHAGATIICGTEGLLDAFHAVRGYDNWHKNLLGYMKTDRWSTTDRLFTNFKGPSSDPYIYPLDIFSWGYSMMPGTSISILQKASRFVNAQRATNGKTIVGFGPDTDKDIVWLEGTGQMVVAYQLAGDTTSANLYISEMRKTLLRDNAYPDAYAIPYATNPGTNFGTSPTWIGEEIGGAISSSTFYLFGALNFNPYAVGRAKNIPAADKFWQ